jgi:hypothetical protein
MSLLVLLAACSRTGTLSGQIAAGTPGSQGVRAVIWVIPVGETFDREWQPTLEAFQEAVRPALERQRAAERGAEQARRTWDRAVAVQGASGVGLSQWNKSTAGRRAERGLWADVQRTAVAAFEAQQRVRKIHTRQSEQAEAMLKRYASHEVLSDADGRYVITQLRPGRAFLYARLRLADRDITWFRPIEVQAGMQQLDLPESSAGGWPFASGA